MQSCSIAFGRVLCRGAVALPLAFAALLSGCATEPPLPPNASTSSAPNAAPLLDTVDFSFSGAGSPSFAKLKLCIAQHLTLPEVQLSDSAGSFVGPATGIHYRANNRQTVAGGSVFKYVDDASAMLVATGIVRAVPALGGLVNDIVRFDLTAATRDTGVTLVFANITRAMQSTGSATNDGFNQVYVAPGSRSAAVYAALEVTTAKLKSCLVVPPPR